MSITTLNASTIIDENFNKIDSFEMSYYYDTTRTLDINDISKLDFNQTISNKFSLGYLKGNSWIKLTLVNNSKREDFLLNFNEVWIYTLNLYTFENKEIIKSENGLHVLLKDKEIKDTAPTFNIHINKGESKTFYIELNAHMATVGKFTLYLDTNSYSENKTISTGLCMFYLGGSFIVVLLNLFLFFTLRERIYAYYSLYVLTFSIHMMSLAGILEHIYPSTYYELLFISPLSIFILILFSQEILETSKYTPSLHKVLAIFSTIFPILAVLIFLDSKIWYELYNSTLPLVSFLILFIAIRSWKKGSRDAGYYIIFMLVYIISLFILAFMALGMIEYNNFTRYAFIYASFFEISFFALVLANRFHKNRQEKQIVEVALEDTKEIANHDGLTHLYNRHYLESYSSDYFNEKRNTHQNTSVIMLDIDKFKVVNDTYGHGVGDIILINVANIFTNLTRESDVVARYGGEEFIIILPNTSMQNAQTIAEKIRINVEKMKTKYEDDKELSVTISLGISLLRADDISMKSVITRADKALYESKATGRNKVSINIEDNKIIPISSM